MHTTLGGVRRGPGDALADLVTVTCRHFLERESMLSPEVHPVMEKTARHRTDTMSKNLTGH